MTYTVNVKGILTVIKQPSEQLTRNWEDFKIKLSSDKKTAKVSLKDRTPWYNDIIAKLYILSQFYEGKLSGKGEDGGFYEIILPTTKEEIIKASERKEWNPEFSVYQKRFIGTDRFYDELQKIGFENLYPEWLKTIPKVKVGY